jgi:DNA-binding transcriptional ArsR family regulator
MTSAPAEQQLDQRLVRALGHPLRQRLLILLHKHGESSPRELALRTGERLTNVSYHVRILRENECIELVRTEPRRGAVEHFYRATARPILDDRQWAQLPVNVRRALFGQTLQEIWDDVLAAADSTGFDDPQCHVSRTWFQLDEIAWNELVDALAGVLDRAFELHAESSERLGRNPDDGDVRKVAMGLLLFERADTADPLDTAEPRSRQRNR